MRVRVSSRPLILASPVFAAMFTGKFQEAVTLQTGSLDLALHEDPPESLIILLNIIHGRTRMIPRLVNINTLTEIAILIDKYQFREIMGLITDTWFEKLQLGSPEGVTETFHQIYLAWMFRQEGKLRNLTESTIWQYGHEFRFCQVGWEERRVPVWVAHFPDPILGEYMNLFRRIVLTQS